MTRRNFLALTDQQLREVQAAAALLRVDSRPRFLHDLAALLPAQPTDADVSKAIADTVGATPTNLGDANMEQRDETKASPRR
jgi:hypothetical protein